MHYTLLYIIGIVWSLWTCYGADTTFHRTYVLVFSITAQISYVYFVGMYAECRALTTKRSDKINSVTSNLAIAKSCASAAVERWRFHYNKCKCAYHVRLTSIFDI